MASSPLMILCRGHNNPLLKCGRKKTTEFYKSRSPFAYYPEGLTKSEMQGYLPFCKECVQKIYEYELDRRKDMQASAYYTCQKLDIPFIVEIFDDVIKTARDSGNPQDYVKLNRRLIGDYIGRLNLAKGKFGDKLDFSYSDTTLSDVDSKIEEREKSKKELDKFKLDWGTQDEAEDYIFLNNTFLKYTKGMEFVNSQQEDLYRDLCRDRLLLRKINDKRYDGDETMDKIQTRIAKIMSILKVDQFESNKPKTFSEESFFAKIAQIELTKPADLYKEPKKYADFNKLQKYERDMVLRPLLNTLCNQRDFNIDIDDVEKYNMDDE